MAERGRDMTAELFGTGATTPSTGGWTTERIKARIRGEAEKQGVDPDLALAVATQESYLNPHARGDNGNSLGLFQLQPAAAIDVGVNPQWRHEPGMNIYGGVSFLKQKLDQSKGNVEEALRRYNGGGDPHYVQNVLRFFKPGVAEASARSQAGTPDMGRSRLDELEAELHRRDAQPGTYTDADVQNALQSLQGSTTPQTSAGGTYSDEDVQNALRSLQGTAPPPAAGRDLTQERFGTPPQAPAEEPITPDARFLRLPSVQQLPMGERVQRFKEFYGLRPEFKDEFLRSEEPPSDLVIDIEKPSTPQAPPPASSTMIEPVSEGGVSRLLADQRTGLSLGEHARVGAATGIGMATTAGGAALGGLTSPVTGPVGPIAGAALGGALGTRVNTALGLTEQETPLLETPYANVYPSDVVGTGLSLLFGLPAAVQTGLRRSRGGRAVQQEGQAAVPEAYEQAVQGQRSAIESARAVPGRYSPETPSWVMYEKFGDAAKDAVVDLAPAKTALAEVRASRGVLPDGTVRPFPSQVETIAAHLEKATGETSIKTIRDELRRLGPLTRHADGNIRGPAKQLYGIYGDALESSPVANDLLRQANATFRREMALQDVQEWLRPGHGVIRIDNQGREVINVGSLLTRLEKTVGDDTLFARSFGADDLQALRQDFGRLAGTPTMPRGGPPAPQSAREAIGERPRFLPGKGGVAGLGGLEFAATSLGVPLGVVTAVKAASAVSQQTRYALAYALTSERLRPLVAAAIRGDGTLNPRVYGLIIAAMTPADKKALERETRGKR